MEIRSLAAEELGNTSHLVLVPEAGIAAAIDPMRDVAQYLDAVEPLGLKLEWALETHVHNDFVSGLERDRPALAVRPDYSVVLTPSLA